MSEYPGLAKIEKLWGSSDADISIWVRDFANNFYDLGLQGMEWRVSKQLRIPLAELVSVLKLASLSDAELSSVAEVNPPRVFWLQIADAKDPDELKALLTKFEKNVQMPSMAAVKKFFEDEIPVTLFDLVRELPAENFWYLAKKTKSVGFGSPKDRSLLASCAKKRGSGEPITIPQAKWATDIIERLIEGRILTVSELEEDSDENLKILKNLNQIPE
jgi:hypothetical protein